MTVKVVNNSVTESLNSQYNIYYDKDLAEQLEKNPSTVSKWCSNVAQPDLATLVKIATLLEVDVQDLLVSLK